MIVYVMTLLSLTALAAISYYTTLKMNKGMAYVTLRRLKMQSIFCVILAGLILFLVSALRYNVGADYGNYRYFVTQISWLSWGKAYILLVRIIQFFSDNYAFFIAINSLIFVIMACKCLKDYTNFHPLSVYLFFCMGVVFQSFCMLRQILAVMVLFYSYRFIIKKKYVKLILGILIAYLFHSSVLIVAPAFLLANLKLEKKYYILGLGTGIVLSPIFYRLGRWYINRIYYGYMDSSVDLLLPLYSIILGIILFILANIHKDSLVGNRDENNTLYNITFFYLIYTCAFAFVPVMSRCFQYFIPFFTILIPRIIESQKRMKQKRFFFIIVIAVYFVFMLGFAIYSDTGVLPYQTILSIEGGVI